MSYNLLILYYFIIEMSKSIIGILDAVAISVLKYGSIFVLLILVWDAISLTYFRHVYGGENGTGRFLKRFKEGDRLILRLPPLASFEEIRTAMKQQIRIQLPAAILTGAWVTQRMLTKPSTLDFWLSFTLVIGLAFIQAYPLAVFQFAGERS